MTLLCRFGLHKMGLLFVDRLTYSRDWVYGVACWRCGKRQRWGRTRA